jgi:hypothetical protein
MLLNEFIYFTKDEYGLNDIDRYDPLYDKSVIKIGDTRKSRLTLKMINRLRKAGEAREREQEEEMKMIKKMYGNPPSPI